MCIRDRNISELKDEWTEIQRRIKEGTESLTNSVANYTVELKQTLGETYRSNPLWIGLNSILIDFSKEYYGDSQISIERAQLAFIDPVLLLANGETAQIKGATEVFNEAKRIQILFFDIRSKGNEIHNAIEMMDRQLPKTNQRMEDLIQTHFDSEFTKEKLEVTKETTKPAQIQ